MRRCTRRKTGPVAGKRGTGRGRGALSGFLGLLAALLVSGCAQVHGIIRTEGAPLFADAAGRHPIDHLDKLAYVDVLSDPDEDPLEVEGNGRRAFCHRDDVWLYRCPDDRSHASLLRRQRREVILAEKPWGPEIKQAIRSDQLRVGMTREMVSLAWGLPASVDRSPDTEVERWTFERRRWDVQLVAYRAPVWEWDPWFGGGRLGYGRRLRSPWGPWWGMGVYWPAYARVVQRRYVPRSEAYVVRFERGLAVSWGPAETMAFSPRSG